MRRRSTTSPPSRRWAAGHGFKGVQIPTWDAPPVRSRAAAESKTYCDEVKGTLAEAGVRADRAFDPSPGPAGRGPSGLRCWPSTASRRPKCAATRRRGRNGRSISDEAAAPRLRSNLGLKAHATFSGALAWPYLYPWPQRPAGLVETAFDELAQALDADPRTPSTKPASIVCYEIHPGEDLHRRRDLRDVPRAGRTTIPRCNILYDPSHFVLQQLDYLDFIDIYHERIRMFHVKDAEFNPTGRAGRLWRIPALGRPGRPLPLAGRRPGRFRRHLLQADAVRLRRLGGAGMGMLHQAPRAGRGARAPPFIEDHIIRVTETRLRRLRRRRHRPGGQPQDARPGERGGTP